MSFSLMLLTLIVLLLTAILSLRIISRYRNAAAGKKPGAHDLLLAYRADISGFLTGKERARTVEGFVHYVLLHLLVPCLGFSFLLRNDLNFLVIIVTILWSLQLTQRIYPGITDEETSG